MRERGSFLCGHVAERLQDKATLNIAPLKLVYPAISLARLRHHH